MYPTASIMGEKRDKANTQNKDLIFFFFLPLSMGVMIVESKLPALMAK